jgi:hypothetical protein
MHIRLLNAAETCRNLHQLLKAKRLHSALHGVYADLLNDTTAVLKDTAGKDEASTIPVKEDEANEGFRELRRRKRSSSDVG